MGRVTSDSVAADQLRAFIERVERLEEEKASIGADIKEVYAEAKGNGFDTKVLRRIVAIRKMDAAERAEQEALLELYLSALGMTPLEEAAARDEDDEEVDPEDIVNPEEAERLYAKAVKLVTDDDKPSTSYIQRKLSLTYNLATSLLERMERDGLVSAPNFAGKREVLRKPDQDDGKVVAIRKGKPKPPHDAVGFDLGAGA